MTTQQVEFFYDVGSPASYLAWTQLPRLCEQAGATLVLRPMLLGGVFQATGNASPAAVPPKGGYVFMDLMRHAQRYGVPFNRNPFFPINTLTLMRAIAGAQVHAPGQVAAITDGAFKAIWVDSLDMNDAHVASTALANAGFPSGEVAQWVSDPAVKAHLKATTEEAVARGVFGAPTMFVDGQMFFGQDRLDWVREALAG